MTDPSNKNYLDVMNEANTEGGITKVMANVGNDLTNKIYATELSLQMIIEDCERGKVDAARVLDDLRHALKSLKRCHEIAKAVSEYSDSLD